MTSTVEDKKVEEEKENNKKKGNVVTLASHKSR